MSKIKMVKRASNRIFCFMIDYNQRIEALVKAGKYIFVDDDVNTKNFPGNRGGQKKIKLKLFRFNRTISLGKTSVEVEKTMDKQGYRPATLKELLTFGINYPKEQRRHPIVALGSIWRVAGGWFVPLISIDEDFDNVRVVELEQYHDDWLSVFRFAAVRK